MTRPRIFDWDDARRLRGEGWTYRALADHFGVSPSAIQLAVRDDYRARCYARHGERRGDRYWIGACVDCDGPATRPPWGTGRCFACDLARRTNSVRPAELLCTYCLEWKPDHAFTPQRANIARRGRHNECKACAAARKRDLRPRARMAA